VGLGVYQLLEADKTFGVSFGAELARYHYLLPKHVTTNEKRLNCRAFSWLNASGGVS
jgi:hypothetical protein